MGKGPKALSRVWEESKDGDRERGAVGVDCRIMREACHAKGLLNYRY